MKRSKEETLAFRLSKSEAVLNEAKSLIINKQWEGAVNRLYYSAFHALSALMLHRNIRIKNRNDSDYEDFAVFTADDVLPLLPQTEEFIDVIKRLIKID